jgi:hypothetical protein
MPKKLSLLILTLISGTSFAHGISPESKAAMLDGGYLQYFWLGAEHMVTGYDHLLFLFGVIFFLNSFKDILKFITAFTIGHSITLISATFIGITANFWLVDAVIALSVCYKGFDNNKGFQSYFGMKAAPNLLLMVFIFGLIHGFGLSTRLQQLPLGDKSVEMLNRIISFNIGVEIGQVAALTFMLGFLTLIRKKSFFKKFSKAANDLLIFLGFILFLMQLHGYQHDSNPDEFRFNEDGHLHHHEEMQKLDEHQESEHDSL